jgi:von Willebrand factor type A domain
MKSSVCFFAISMICAFGMMACDSSTEPGDTTNTEYHLAKLFVETEDPAYVNILFQVTDGAGIGVDDLQTADFIVREDGSQVSPTESRMKIKKMDEVDYTIRTVLMLDISPSVESEFSKIQAAALSMVNNIVENQSVAVYTFSSEIVRILDFSTDKQDIIDAINGIEIQPGSFSTDLYGGIISGVNQWTDSYSLSRIKQGFLVMITDGSDEASNHTLEAALNARDDKWVYTIGLGDEIDEYVLEELGNRGFFHVTDSNNLTGVFNKVQADILKFANSFYWLYYLSGLRDSDNHELNLRVNGNSNNLENYELVHTFNSAQFMDLAAGAWLKYAGNFVAVTDTLVFYKEQRGYFEAVSHWSDIEPIFTWSLDPSGMVEIDTSDDPLKAAMVFKTPGLVDLTLTDTANIAQHASFGKTFTFRILDRDVETITYDFEDGLVPDNFNGSGEISIASEIAQGDYSLKFIGNSATAKLSYLQVAFTVDLPASSGYIFEYDLSLSGQPLSLQTSVPGRVIYLDGEYVEPGWMTRIHDSSSGLQAGLQNFGLHIESEEPLTGYIDNITITYFPK